jgi:hypothetical protein
VVDFPAEVPAMPDAPAGSPERTFEPPALPLQLLLRRVAAVLGVLAADDRLRAALAELGASALPAEKLGYDALALAKLADRLDGATVEHLKAGALALDEIVNDAQRRFNDRLTGLKGLGATNNVISTDEGLHDLAALHSSLLWTRDVVTALAFVGLVPAQQTPAASDAADAGRAE